VHVFTGGICRTAYEPQRAALVREPFELLDDEIARLPERNAQAIVSCHLQRKTHTKAA
jgi:hypothetical protein